VWDATQVGQACSARTTPPLILSSVLLPWRHAMRRRPNLTGGLTLAGIVLFSGRFGGMALNLRRVMGPPSSVLTPLVALCRCVCLPCCSCYTAALTQDRAYGKLAPYG
jgi:uncharacterized membrane protein YgdD (TMEM256/DUF423 family)